MFVPTEDLEGPPGRPAARLLFDQGTVLVRDAPGGLDLASLPGTLWDPRVGAYRTPAWRYAEVRAALARGGAPLADEVCGPRPAPAGWSPVELRPYQDAALSSWDLAGRRGVIALPTGSGKTRVALAAMAGTRARALCLVPTRVLLEQWHREIALAYGGRIGLYGDGERALAPITVATFESAYRHMAHLGNLFDLLVIDEAHHFGSGARDEALEMCTASARLGLTATPPRAGPAVAGLATLIGPTVFELRIGDLAGTFLADFDLVLLRLELAPDERAAYDADMRTFRAVRARFEELAPRASWGDFARAAARTPAGREALAALKRARGLLAFTRAKSDTLRVLLRRHRDARILVFTADNPTAYAIARRHLIMPLTCHIPRREREDALGRFRRGELRALVSARVLNEGLDVPDADVAVVVGGALGEREHVQRVGRLLRPAPGKRAVVYELVARRTIEERQAMRRRDGLVARSPAAS